MKFFPPAGRVVSLDDCDYDRRCVCGIAIYAETGAAMKTGSWKKWIPACVLAVLALPGGAAASPVDGAWMIQDLVLNIFDCQHLVCGQIVWIKDPARRPAQCGRTIVWGLAPKSPSSWTGGSILDPDNGSIYRLSATYERDGMLHARIFRGVPVFGKTEILKRVDLRSLTGRC
jgi:uncharacterized protein (DUF2147 family)